MRPFTTSRAALENESVTAEVAHGIACAVLGQERAKSEDLAVGKY